MVKQRDVMNIIYILSGTSVTGGATKSFISMLEQVQKRGHDVCVICPSQNGIYNVLKGKKIMVYAIKYRFASLPIARNIIDILKWIPRLIYTLVCNQLAYKKLLKFAKDWVPDIIHENTSVTDIGYKVASDLKIPCVMHIREYGDKDFGLHLYSINKRIKSSNVYTIPITKDIGQYRGVYGRERCCQIYNGIIEEIDIRYNPEKSRFFLYAGRIERAKGIEDLLDAYLEYCNTNTNPIPLKIAGAAYDKQYLERLKGRVENTSMVGYVEWLGERNDIKDLYHSAVLTIIPSYFEGLGRVMPEAMANGCLCAGRNTGGTKEQFDTGFEITGKEIGLRFKGKRDLCNIFNEITVNYDNGNAFFGEGIYKEIIMKSQEAVVHNFTIESFGIKLMDFYGKILYQFRVDS